MQIPLAHICLGMCQHSVRVIVEDKHKIGCFHGLFFIYYSFNFTMSINNQKQNRIIS